MFFDSFARLCDSVGKRPSRVADELGISRATVTQWKNKPDIVPNGVIQQKIAAYFNISLDELMGIAETKKAPAEAEAPTRENLRFALSGEVNGPLKEEQVDEVLEFARFIYERDKNKEKK